MGQRRAGGPKALWRHRAAHKQGPRRGSGARGGGDVQALREGGLRWHLCPGPGEGLRVREIVWVSLCTPAGWGSGALPRWTLCWKWSLHGGHQCSRLPMSRSEQLMGGLRLGAGKNPRSQGQGWNGPGLLQDDPSHTAHPTVMKRRPGAPVTVLGTAQPAWLPQLPVTVTSLGEEPRRLSLPSCSPIGPKTFIGSSRQTWSSPPPCM